MYWQINNVSNLTLKSKIQLSDEYGMNLKQRIV